MLDLLKSAGFWPWLILLVVLVIAAGDRIGVIRFPGGEVNPGRGPAAQGTPATPGFDTRLERTDADVSWSLRLAADGRSIIPSSQARLWGLLNRDEERPRQLGLAFMSGHSDRQMIMIGNAVQETLEIGSVQRTRRYEITPQQDGGLDLHYVDLTPVSIQRGLTVATGLSQRTLHFQYVDARGRPLHSFPVNARFNSRLKLWEGG